MLISAFLCKTKLSRGSRYHKFICTKDIFVWKKINRISHTAFVEHRHKSQ